MQDFMSPKGNNLYVDH